MTKTHVAQLCVAVLSRNVSIVEAGELFVKGASSCLKLANAIGFYASGTVFEPKFYIEASTVMKEDTLPILNWIYFGFTRGKQGPGIYTYGMTAFGKDELEILDPYGGALPAYGLCYETLRKSIKKLVKKLNEEEGE